MNKFKLSSKEFMSMVLVSFNNRSSLLDGMICLNLNLGESCFETVDFLIRGSGTCLYQHIASLEFNYKGVSPKKMLCLSTLHKIKNRYSIQNGYILIKEIGRNEPNRTFTISCQTNNSNSPSSLADLNIKSPCNLC